MIIPVRCFTCNNILGSRYKKYLELMKQHDERFNTHGKILTANPDIESQLSDNRDYIFKKLGFKRYCCRRHLVSHVDLINKI
jgi:DNA-directed RNA polymerase subunit N